MKCETCGAMLADGAYFCPECGSLVSSNTNDKNNANTQDGIQTSTNSPETQTRTDSGQCTKCGAELKPGEKFCSACGHKAEIYATVGETAKKNTSVIVVIVVAFVAVLACAVCAAMLVINGGLLKSEPVPSVQPTASPTALPTATPYQKPSFTNISATSVRPVDYTSGSAIYYPVENAVDGDFSTCWSSDRNYELTPTLTLSAATPQHVKGIRLSNGYFKSWETYTRNRRITRAEIIYEGGSKVVNMSIDSYRIMHDIPFDTPVDTTYIKIHVIDTYYGDWKDICISEVEIY